MLDSGVQAAQVVCLPGTRRWLYLYLTA